MGAKGDQGIQGAKGDAGVSPGFLAVNIDGTINSSYSDTSATVSNPSAGVYCIGGLSPGPKSAVVSGGNRYVAPLYNDTIATVRVATPPGDTLVSCANTDQVRVTTYAAGQNGTTGLVNRDFYIWLVH